MRNLTEKEMHAVFKKLAEYTGASLKDIIVASNSHKADRNVFRVSQQRVFLVRDSIAKFATSISRDKLLSLGTCLGRLTKSGRFRLHISALSLLAEYARHKIYIRPNGEMTFLYGSHVQMAHVGRWPQDCPAHQGVVICGMDDTPLGFGITANSTSDAKRLGPTGIACFRQADCGEYLRDEDNLFAS